MIRVTFSLFFGSVLLLQAQNPPEQAMSRRGVPVGGPYILPVAEASAHFARNAEPDAAFADRLVELPQVVAGRVAQVGYLDGGDAA